MKKLFSTIALSFMLLLSVSLFSQTIPKTMNIYEKNGTVTKIPLDRIEKITFDGPQITYTKNVVRDGDGNIYQTVKIGHQVWMASNLKTTKYIDGTPITNIRIGEEWIKTKSGAYCWYMNNSDNKEVFGGLYNWYAVAEDKICPRGFHVPRKEEWGALIGYLGSREAGAKLRVAGDQYWKDSQPQTDNSSGFSALPGGVRHANATFQGEGTIARWWAIDPRTPDEGEAVILYNNGSAVIHPARKMMGFSVRCVRD